MRNYVSAETMLENAQRQDASTRRTICPKCGHIRFYATNSYRLVGGVRKRLRQCFACGFAQTETVPEPQAE